MRFSPMLAIVLFVRASLASAEAPPVDYSRDIKPILANSCYACHGPDDKARKAKLRLDVREEAVKSAIVPGSADKSPIVQRMLSHDVEEVMPPPKSKKPAITPAQVATLKVWIDRGAKYDSHWAYAPPPPMRGTPANEIDLLVGQARPAGVKASPTADRVVSIRRLYFDLTGLPPSPAEVKAFVGDTAADAWPRLVDKVLASKHYGERMAVWWLDAVRYADTGGYHSDNHRDVSLFRDYVIDAFDSNMPFDRFTAEQLAGDLLPNPTRAQRIASGYNRLLMTTEEGGAQAKEYTAKYSADRVRNASSVWMGATLGCAECHNHKFDPYTAKDFYTFAAFFADVQEVAVGRQAQTILATPEQQVRLDELQKVSATAAAAVVEGAKGSVEAEKAWRAKVEAEAYKGLAKAAVDAFKIEPAKRTPAQKKAIEEAFQKADPNLAGLKSKADTARVEAEKYRAALPSTLVTTATTPRTVRILPRGNWNDDTGEIVTPAIPAFLGALPKTDKRPTRLDLARWLTSRDNPLTARVYVNRVWKLLFGYGLARNLDDLGTQGPAPVLPILLDRLAVEFADGWDTKALIRRIVLSETYRLSSVPLAASLEADPANQYLSRQNRWRHDAEFVRDNALSIAGLLVDRVGGDNARPYQPAGYWSFLNFPTRDWTADKGEGQYRRGMYTYWCRSFPHPSLLAFDAPSREECTVERPRSSTPLQALILLNDPTYLEAAKAFAASILKDGGKSTGDRLNYAGMRAISREWQPEELAVLEQLLAKHRVDYTRDPAAADKLLGPNATGIATIGDRVELAAWTSVARAILNLHETIVRN